MVLQVKNQEIKVAFLGSSTLDGIATTLSSICTKHDIDIQSYVAPYAQYHQMILDPKSKLYQFAPDITILVIDAAYILNEYYDFPYRIDDKNRKEFIQTKVDELLQLVKAFTSFCHGKLIVHNLSVPNHSPYGILETKQPFGLFKMIRFFNDLLEEKSCLFSQVFVFDFNHLSSLHGKLYQTDPKLLYLADIKISPQLYEPLCLAYLHYFHAFLGKTKKCLVLDLDNTLWGGILGEEGINNIHLGPTAPGNAFVDFQKDILNLFERGILLAINSNNDYKEAINVIRNHPHMILREQHFSSIQINWHKDKVVKMMDIQKELNIGFNSFVFIDDDPVNQNLVKQRLPEIDIVPFPTDQALLSETLRNYIGFETLYLTPEDQKRGQMYFQEKQRSTMKKKLNNLNSFLQELNLKVQMSPMDEFSIPRISQLTFKTNQFNLTQKKYSEETLLKLSKLDHFQVYSIKVMDKFGDYGIVGCIFLEKKPKLYWVHNFLLSCRVLGRNVEKAVLYYLNNLAFNEKMGEIFFEFNSTKKNEPAKIFLKKMLLKNTMKTHPQLWKFPIKEHLKCPTHVSINSIKNI